MPQHALEALQDKFFGIDRVDLTAGGKRLRRRYLDSAASCLMLEPAYRCAAEFLPHYANTHSEQHFAARAASEAYHWAHVKVLEYTRAAPGFVPIFTGAGATSGLNRLARALSESRPERRTVLVSLMEHHSNDLPHRRWHRRVVHVECSGRGRALAGLSLEHLERQLRAADGQVDYVAVTGASNVTGILNEIAPIAKLCHDHGALLVVDGSQLVAHSTFALGAHVDAFVFSGHKAYIPGSPGVLLVRDELLSSLAPSEFGGGMVEHVWKDSFEVSRSFPAREEAGTPNILGAVMLGFGLEFLGRVGLDAIVRHEQSLLDVLLSGLQEVPNVSLYGSLDRERHPRVGIVSFNIKGVDHGLVAAILNDYFNVSVRNECFCAHPYVRELLLEDIWDAEVGDEELDEEFVKRRQGMVRASLGLYNTLDDVIALLEAVAAIADAPQSFCKEYRMRPDGSYTHAHFEPNPQSRFVPGRAIEDWLHRNVSR